MRWTRQQEAEHLQRIEADLERDRQRACGRAEERRVIQDRLDDHRTKAEMSLEWAEEEPPGSEDAVIHATTAAAHASLAVLAALELQEKR